MKKILKTILGVGLALSFAFVPSVIKNEDTSSITTVSAASGIVYVKVGELRPQNIKVRVYDNKLKKYVYKTPVSYVYNVYYYGKKQDGVEIFFHHYE